MRIIERASHRRRSDNVLLSLAWAALLGSWLDYFLLWTGQLSIMKQNHSERMRE
jgi:hypothetical protein